MTASHTPAPARTRVLITGGFGAVGSNLIQALLAEGGYEIHVIDNLSSGTANVSPHVTFTYIDISNAEKMRGFFRTYQPELIYHLAAHFANQNSVEHPISDTTANIIGTINLFENQRSNLALRKIVFASSSCVYGNGLRMDEEAPVAPWDTPYAINKYAGEMYCRYYAEVHQIPVVCARLFNSYGPGEMPGRYRNVVPNFIQRAIKGEDITITGSGDETRDFTYISDTIDLLRKMADSSYRKAEVFNGGTGLKTSIRTLAQRIIAVTGSTSKIVYAPPRNWDHVKDRCASIDRSRALLGYSPKVPLDDGLRETASWLRVRLGT